MKKSNLNRLALSGLLTTMVFLNACKKDRIKVDPIPHATAGVYVLCEGGYNVANSSSITYYDVAAKTTVKNHFKTVNGIELGTNANSLKQYGSKMYCVVTGSTSLSQDAYIEVIQIATGKSIKRIPFYNGSGDFSPRNIAFYQNKAYVTSYDGYISKIDTTTLTIESRILAGGALEGIAIVNGKIFAANSAHSIYGTSNNSSVSVLDIASFTKVAEIPVNYNPTKLAPAANGDVYVITNGNYGDIAPALEKINSLTNVKTQLLPYNLGSLEIGNGKGYLISYDYPALIKTFNLSTGALGNNIITDNTEITSAYALTLNNLDNSTYISDARDYVGDGKIFCFDANGKWKYDFTTGNNPQSAVFNYTYK